MFPQLIAGPIVQYKTVAADLEHRIHTSENFALGARRFCVGLAKKVLLANSIGALWEDVPGGPGSRDADGRWAAGWAWPPTASRSTSTSPATPTWPSAWGGCLGFRFNENFDHPYLRRLGDGVLAAVAHVPHHLVPGVPVYPPGGQPGRHRQDASATFSSSGSAPASGTGPAGTSSCGACTSPPG